MHRYTNVFRHFGVVRQNDTVIDLGVQKLYFFFLWIRRSEVIQINYAQNTKKIYKQQNQALEPTVNLLFLFSIFIVRNGFFSL